MAILQLDVRPSASLDLKTILRAIQQTDPMVAERLSEEFEARFERLRITGGALRVRTDLGKDVKAAKFKAWMIFYRTTNTDLIILRVLHGAVHPARLRASLRSS